MRTPLILGIEVVRSYDEFVWHIQNKPIPQLISFDHDLSFEHYPFEEDRPGLVIPYDTFKEKTGWHCARYIVENQISMEFWAVHSFNAVGRQNIERELRQYRPQGEVRGLKIPYRVSGWDHNEFPMLR
jgi:hypothetical protein